MGSIKRYGEKLSKTVRKKYMIVLENIKKSTRLTVCKYDDYQCCLHSKQTQSKRTPSATPTLTIMNNNEDNEIKNNVPPTLFEVQAYFLEKGFSDVSAKTAFDYYTRLGWVDSQGKKVKNWKLKMTSVWFKEENKIQISSSERKMVY